MEILLERSEIKRKIFDKNGISFLLKITLKIVYKQTKNGQNKT